MEFTEKMVLGTAQFGMDYGITNVNGKPTRKEVFNILDFAWGIGVRRFDTAPGYDSETLLGDFLVSRGLQDQIKILTKISSLEGLSNYKTKIRASIESSLKKLSCSIDILFFHNPKDSELILECPQFFENLLHDYQISSLGISVYEPDDVKKLSGCPLDLAFQFPCNVLDRRFENVSMPKGKRYARSIFLQGLLASEGELRPDSPKELQNLQKNYHEKLAKKNLDPVSIAVSFVTQNDVVDYFLIGVDSEKQLKEIQELELYGQKDIAFPEILFKKTDNEWFDPRKWN